LGIEIKFFADTTRTFRCQLHWHCTLTIF